MCCTFYDHIAEDVSKFKIINTMVTRFFHKGHKALNTNIFFLCLLCILSVCCVKMTFKTAPTHISALQPVLSLPHR